MDHEETVRLIVLAQRGDLAARNAVVEANLGLVGEVIARTARGRRCTIPREDLMQEGCFGLIRAIEKFDLSLGLRFSTYAGSWIGHFIQDAMRRRFVAVPKWADVHAMKWRRLRREGVPDDKIAAVMGLSRRKERNVRLAMEIDCGRVRQIATEFPLVDGSDAPDAPVIRAEEEARLHEAISRLKPSYREVLVMRYGIDRAKPPMTFLEIGEVRGCTKTNVGSLHSKARRCLAEQLAY